MHVARQTDWHGEHDVANTLAATAKVRPESEQLVTDDIASGQILIIASQLRSAVELEKSLNSYAFEVRRAATLEDAQQLLEFWTPDAILVELTPPCLTPLSFSAALRCKPQYDRISILFAVPAELNSDMVQLECLTSGADAVVSLPLRMPVLVARLKAAVRNVRCSREDSCVFRAGRLRLDHRQRKAWADDRELRLTPSEYEILYRLIRSPGEVCDRSELVGKSRTSDPLASTRTIDVHVYSLRRKLGQYGAMIETIKGEGYCVTVVDA